MKSDEQFKRFVEKSTEKYKELHWEGNFFDYIGLVQRDNKIVRNAFRRLYDMILSYGVVEIPTYKKKLIHYKFFDDPIDNGKDAIYGLNESLMNFVNILKAAAEGLGPERRILLFHGPVGSAKSTIVRLLKKGLEEYSKKPEGAIYTFGWSVDNPWQEGVKLSDLEVCPMHEDPLNLLPLEERNAEFYKKYLNIDFHIESYNLCPFCQYYFNMLMTKYQGDWMKVLTHVRVFRFTLSEAQRKGIGTFQPKDEKNQDSTELTGDINYRKIAIYGSDSDPRCFNFDGEFNVANRGLIEFVEVLKLDVAFLYDLLGATQEHKIKPKKFPQCDIDEVIIAHTNSPEFVKLQENEYMEALRDRTIRIDIPYNTKLSEEIKIYEKEFNPQKVTKHIAPHTIEIAAMWAILSRLDPPKKSDLTLLQKMKLYNGKTITGYTEENIKELKDAAPNEGMKGISPRYIQDKTSQALSTTTGNCVNPFMVMNMLKEGLTYSTLITSEEEKKRYIDLLQEVRDEYENIVKDEVRKAIASNKEALSALCANYIENVRAYCEKEKVKNEFTGEDEDPNEELMRSVEERIDVNEATKDSFRHELMQYIGTLAVKHKKFTYETDDRLRKALEMKLFEDSKDSINITSVVSSVTTDEQQEKIEIVKKRLIDEYGYCDECATNVLRFVASIFARGDAKADE